MVAVLKKSEYARVNSFDLIGTDGWELLKDLVVENFPYLTLADLGATMNLGIMGKLDKYKSMPLNVPRVYQWVEQRAPYSLGYWRHRFPELLRWAELCKVLDSLLPKLSDLYAEHGGGLLKSAVTYVVTEHIAAVRCPKRALGIHDDPAEAAAHRYMAEVLWPQLEAEHPAFAAKHPHLF